MNSMKDLKNLQVRLRRRPAERAVTREHYEFLEGPLAPLQEGEILLRVIYASVDAGHRAMMGEAAYVVNLNIGDLFPCSGIIGQVIRTRNTDLNEGDFVHVLVATWERYCVVSAQHLYHKIDPSAAPLPAQLAIMGLTGFTAFFLDM
jgi:NADPH-dependent curcumin reductase CurA